MSGDKIMIDFENFQSRMGCFPRRYMENFDYVWKWKIKVESKNKYILDKRYRTEAYRRLCKILPRWQTYRNGENTEPLETLNESLTNISDSYNQIRNYTLLDFDKIPYETIETIWHELGRVKEYNGYKNELGKYSIISVCKPLLLIWGQTLAFDSRVRKNCPRRLYVPKYLSKWDLKHWIAVMKKFSSHLKNNLNCINIMSEESVKRYGADTIVPFGRFLDIYYWVDS